MNKKILCVDDDPNILDGVRRSLRKQYEIETATGGEAALAVMAKTGPFAVIVADMRMPGMDGVELLGKARESAPDTVRMMLTGDNDIHTAMHALNEGRVFRFMMKPCSPENLAHALDAGLEQHRLIVSEKELLENTLRGSVRILVEILSAASPEMFDRAQHLRAQMRELATALGAADVWSLELAAMLCNIGAVTVPLNTHYKADRGLPLTDTEQAIMNRVPELSAHLIGNVPRLEAVAEIIRLHSINFDGSNAGVHGIGQPLPLGARMLRVLIDWNQAESKGFSYTGTLATLRHRTGVYDPRVLDEAAKIFSIQAAAKTISTTPPVSMELASLRAGHVLASNLEGVNGKLLIAAGHTITETMLAKIRNYHEIAVIKEPIQVERPHTAVQRAA